MCVNCIKAHRHLSTCCKIMIPDIVCCQVVDFHQVFDVLLFIIFDKLNLISDISFQHFQTSDVLHIQQLFKVLNIYSIPPVLSCVVHPHFNRSLKFLHLRRYKASTSFGIGDLIFLCVFREERFQVFFNFSECHSVSIKESVFILKYGTLSHQCFVECSLRPIFGVTHTQPPYSFSPELLLVLEPFEAFPSGVVLLPNV